MMGEIIRIYLPWVMSAVTIYMTLLAGNKHRHAWAIGLANQVLWLIWIFASESWGLLPMTAALTFVYARNHLKWRMKSGPCVAFERETCPDVDKCCRNGCERQPEPELT